MRPHFLQIFFILIFSFVALHLFSNVEFETKRVRDTYMQLPVSMQKMTEENKLNQNFTIRSENIIQGSQIKISFNSINQINHIGLNLFEESEKKGDYSDAYLFIENSMLNFALQSQVSGINKIAKDREISFYIDKKLVVGEIKNMISFSDIVKSKKFTLNLEENSFIGSWTSIGGGHFAMKFPADVNLLKGMDKGELEADLVRRINVFAISNILVPQNQEYKGDQKLQQGLYIQKGTYFETDDFRSDIYLTKKSENAFLPVFSIKYPIESYSNLFMCNLGSMINVDLTVELYGNKKSTLSLQLKKLQAFLSENNESFFGLQSNKDNVLKATIIYYNKTYRYIHMMVVESDKSELFSNKERTIKANLYTYIPQANFVKEVIYE